MGGCCATQALMVMALSCAIARIVISPTLQSPQQVSCAAAWLAVCRRAPC